VISAQFADSVEEEMRPLMIVAVERGAVMLQNRIKRILTGARHGRWYKVPGTLRTSLKTRRTTRSRGRMHRASAPGEPPAVLFGRLRNSIVHTPAEARKFTRDGARVLVARSDVGVADHYPEDIARKLEFGGRNSDGSRFYARPFLRPGVDAEAPAIEMLWARIMGRAAPPKERKPK
jgi:hypothetical protein